MSDWGVTRCPKCGGWTRCLDRNWVVPHFRKSNVCKGSSERTDGRVYSEAEFEAMQTTAELRARPAGVPE